MTDQLKYGDGEPVSLWREACKMKPSEKVAGQHLCKRHKSHDDECKCICGYRFGAGVVVG